jgi:hypothetical protein
VLSGREHDLIFFAEPGGKRKPRSVAAERGIYEKPLVNDYRWKVVLAAATACKRTMFTEDASRIL